MKTMKLITALVMVLALPALAGAQCGDPDNLVSADLCGFDTPASVGPTAWFVTPYDPILFPYDGGTVVHQTTGGRTSPGSMLATAVDNGVGYLMAFEICVPGAVAEGTELGFGLHGNTDALVELGYLHLIPTNSDCSGAVGNPVTVDVGMAPPTPGSYGKLNANDATLTVPANTEGLSIQVFLARFSGPFSMVVDDAYIGTGMVPVELQSFSID